LTTELLLLAAAGALVFYLLGRWDRALTASEEAWARATKATLEAGTRWRQRQDSLARAADNRASRARQAASRAERYQRQAAAIRATMQAEPEQAHARSLSLIVTLDSAVAAWRQAYLEETTARATERLRAELAEQRVRALESLLATSPARRGCRVAWLLPCPSRKTAFIAGVAVGAATVLLARD
jgi:membrane protein required for beta-lactamase induction